MDSFQESFGSSIFVRTKRESGSGLSLVAIAAGNGITQKGSHLYILLSFGQGKKYGFSFLFRQKVYFRPQPVWLQGMVQEEAPYLSWREGWEQHRIKSYRCFHSLPDNFFASGCWSCTYANVIRACKKRKYVQHWTFPLKAFVTSSQTIDVSTGRKLHADCFRRLICTNATVGSFRLKWLTTWQFYSFSPKLVLVYTAISQSFFPLQKSVAQISFFLQKK